MNWGRMVLLCHPLVFCHEYVHFYELCCPKPRIMSYCMIAPFDMICRVIPRKTQTLPTLYPNVWVASQKFGSSQLYLNVWICLFDPPFRSLNVWVSIFRQLDSNFKVAKSVPNIAPMTSMEIGQPGLKKCLCAIENTENNPHDCIYMIMKNMH